ncbi:MAG: imidazole glycerol phosphate synthase subunit HisH [Verrucomicrobia bacterium]|nr:imidazole glycerol phosphate synthase subunit HisH [Verrucomicrobiota bacterium]MCG2681891.1 imidazole glycerol phosphate synthase subunit HisH [Kiritimatiellia bacterium]MBU4246731.1 imidazole glycerol phosphate synthase subunit HisH [Verrucomicrobiota bacterium]MBU4291152.1 imidazole glycerol phosphate synthase subunit HisH [Verrucomicrobiota bacterium]MBU4429264.1 imidazole glycerol phosphate synthase subunit HisH [Verrucomicrobiota bacterium]
MIAIVNYKAGNLTSVQLAFDHLKVPCEITSDPARILAADRVVFPGVGSAGAAMQSIRALGLDETLRTVVQKGMPFLGICLGTQIIFDSLEEDGGVQGLGIIPGTVRRFMPDNPRDKVPQIGWNTVTWSRPHPLFEGIAKGSEFYFVHSYYPAPASGAVILGETEYAGVRFASVVGLNNLAATQFHPEKSGRIGLRLLENFCRWKPI